MNLKKLNKEYNNIVVRKYKKPVKQILALSDYYEAMSDKALRNQTCLFKKRLASGESLDDIKIEAFAAFREAAYRVLGMKPYPVQLLGGLILNDGNVAEMKTGEGKSLAATIPAYFNALTGHSVFIVTVNDYLAERDKEQFEPLYNFMGMTDGLISSGMETEERQNAYQADIVYGTNSEFGFDYLRDNICAYSDEQVQPERFFAIIDEADSILIDEARTPLIISGLQGQKPGDYISADLFVKELHEKSDYEKDDKEKTIFLTENGISKAEKYFHVANLSSSQNTNLFHDINKALYANYMMQLGKDYIVRDDKVVIVDGYTGRVMPSRQYSDGLHQAIEAKEGVKINDETQSIATITIQNYFKLFDKLGGMTGTGSSVESEFTLVYNMGVLPVPTNKPVQRKDQPDIIYSSERTKIKAIVNEVIKRHQKGQPVLIGTISVAKSEILSRILKMAHVPHTVLNAKNPDKEAEIVAQAGQKGAVTISTDMAGRGTDIKLGEGVDKLGGLYVIGTERHESERVDDQLRGRSGRQGDPGESRFFLSLDDELFKLYGGKKAEMLKRKYQDRSIVVKDKAAYRIIEEAQIQLEEKHFDERKNILSLDNVINYQRKVIYNQRQQVLCAQNPDPMINEMTHDVINLILSRATWKKTLKSKDDQKAYEEKVDINRLIRALNYFHISLARSELKNIHKLSELKILLDKKFHNVYDSQLNEFGQEIAGNMKRRVLLENVDNEWKNHLTDMQDLRQGIGLRSYGQNDPVVEFTRDGSAMFEKMNQRINYLTVRELISLTA